MRTRSALAQAGASALLFAALGDETRLKLIARLSEHGPMSISALTAGSSVTRQAIAKHLRVMESARLVHGVRQGRESIWELDRRRLEDARRYLALISQQWDDALARLRDFLEG
jgi:DNA-binding transcriptional ArsR family regulator